MFNKIIEFSIKNKLIVGLFILALIGYGSYQVTQLPIDAVPDITDNQVQVITVTPSLGAPDVERLITFPIEQANRNIPGLKKIRSFSRFGLSLITIVFNDDVDIYWARQQVTERLKIAEQEIPQGIGSPELAPVTTGLGEIYQYVLKAKRGYETKYSATELRTIQDWIVKRQLTGVKGVADVSSFGGLVKQYEVAINPNDLKSHNLTLNDVFTALEKNNENTGGAYIEKASTVLFIRSEGLIGSLEDIKKIVVKNTENGTPLLINDIAKVKIGNATRYGAMTYNDEGEVAGAVVMMLKGDNSSQVIKDVKEKINQIQNNLPEGVEIEPFLDRTKMVNSAIDTVVKNLIEGALIVIVILVLFLGNLRAGIIVASVIPLSMLFAIIMMNMFGVSGNLMSLGALDFGLIVDGAVIIVEACMFQLHISNQKTVSQIQMDDIVYKTSTRMRSATVFGVLIILAVYLPIFSLEGIEGKMFKPMAQTVAFALLGAFILSLTYVPSVSSLFLSKIIPSKKTISDKLMELLERVHQRSLSKILNVPKTVVSGAVILFIASMFVLLDLGGEFIPELPEGDFAVETRVLTGSSITTSTDAILRSSKVLLSKFPEIEKIVGKTGSGEIPTDPMPMEASDMMIILKDKSEWTSANTWNELSDKMTEALKVIPGVTYSFQYPVAMRFNELMTGAKQDVVCKIFGENLDTLSKYSKLLGEIAGKIDGAKNIYVEPIDGLPQLIITYKRNEMAQFGLNIKDVNRIVNTAFAGQSSGLLYEDEKRFDIVVRLAGDQRKNLEDVQNLLIPTPKGTQIPLNQVADVTIKESVNQIQREDAKRRIIVGFNVGDRDVQSIVTDLQKQIDKKIKFPSGYFVTYGGAFDNLIAAKKRLSFAVPVSLILIFFLLYFAFSSIKQGLLIYSAIPLSAIGGIFFLALRGMPFSISAGIGFIALFGVAVLNGIVLISEYNKVKKDGETDLKQIVLLGTKHRLRPVLMTAFVASLGFLPMALSNGAGAEVQRPLATVVIGGLLIATLLTLFVLPVLYILFEKGTKSSQMNKTVITACLLLFLGTDLNAQTSISLPAAIDTAFKNNLTLKNDQLTTEYFKKLKASGVDIPQTNVVGEYGQINSFYKDTKFSVSQSLKFPSVYAKQRSVLNEEWKSSVLTVAIKQNELKKKVTLTYFELIYLQEKLKLLQRTDSIYAQFLKNAELRFSKGESNVLEKTTAESQRGQVNQQLKQIEQDIGIVQLQFQLLLNSSNNFVPEIKNKKMELSGIVDTSSLKQHPTMSLLKQEQEVNFSRIKLERSKLLPDLFVSYNNMSMQGAGADNKTYGSSTRFQSIQAGIGLPIFSSSQRSRINALKVNQQIADNNYVFGLTVLRSEYQQALLTYKKNLQTISYYETTALSNADIILNTALKQFNNGDVNYLEWVLLVNQSVSIKSDYVDALRSLNQSIIQLNSLTTK
ncbi:MAG: CusA/CzcA family heavy metal efflux RND transporter [Bacteroidia bacterium]|nr:CusA/CzcA family heavy metal efflux RND transporter [Bacteroidia bacterium]